MGMRSAVAMIFCAWILWGNAQTGRPWAALDSYETKAACESAHKEAVKSTRLAGSIAYGHYSRVTRCWPVGVDPRGKS